ncbi:class I SAM-dependent methyltransferase [Microbacterium sp. 3J1]|uniref:class I SAM-dependent methyltransferase n=1 Tax=Microbacterium sp. 3J1 TaxID=861269 RepID=UPI000AC59063|nr:class I SAM-dependent methyltransferase [Microbacterium sp. 3J1]
MVDGVLARSFERTGADYDRYRPGFPAEAADLLVPDRVASALDLGAGTGKFTALLLGRAAEVVAVEPSGAMLDVLRAKLPAVAAHLGSAERIPVPDSSMSVVSVAQAFHWFERDEACTEIRRVLVENGRLGLIWNRSNPSCAWDRAAHRVAHPAVSDADGTTSAAAADLPGFEPVARQEVHWTERISRSDYLRRWATVSTFLVADPDTRAEMLAQIVHILDEHPETHGSEDLELPIVTDVFVYRRA